MTANVTDISTTDSSAGGPVWLTVQDELDRLQATRNAEWTPEHLEANASVRRGLEQTADRRRFVKVGDVVDPFDLAESGGGRVVLTELLETGPVVLLFFRFEGCPACNVALRGYQATVAGALHELGAHLVAVSPQVVDRLGAIKERQQLDFLVASDPEASLIDAFGIGFAPDDDARRRSVEAGNDLGATLGTGRWTLPYPTAVVIGRDRVVRFADVHPDWMVRTAGSVIVDAVRTLTAPVA